MSGAGSRPDYIEWGVASRPRVGELACGDRAFVHVTQDRVLVAALDALGHGQMAAATAQLALEALEEHATKPVTQIFEHCHQALLRSRGVAMSVALIDPWANTLTWTGVGNVDGLLLRAGQQEARAESLTVLSGVVGYQIPRLRPTVRTLGPGDLLVFATDGMDGHYAGSLRTSREPDEMARALLAAHAKDVDDALILIVRYLGARQ